MWDSPPQAPGLPLRLVGTCHPTAAHLRHHQPPFVRRAGPLPNPAGPRLHQLQVSRPRMACQAASCLGHAFYAGQILPRALRSDGDCRPGRGRSLRRDKAPRQGVEFVQVAETLALQPPAAGSREAAATDDGRLPAGIPRGDGGMLERLLRVLSPHPPSSSRCRLGRSGGKAPRRPRALQPGASASESVVPAHETAPSPDDGPGLGVHRPAPRRRQRGALLGRGPHPSSRGHELHASHARLPG